jgi:TM2 domain-containing membrane protein YozV
MSSPETPTPIPPAAPPPLPPAYSATAGVRPIKNPWVAAALSFLFPGLGQVYNGQIAKALVFFFAFVGSIYAVTTIDPLPWAFGIPFSYLFNIVDAFRSAAVAGARQEEEDQAESPAWGISLVVLGVVFLLNNLGWLNLAAISRFWPVLLIVAGAIFIYSSSGRRSGAKGDGGFPL